PTMLKLILGAAGSGKTGLITDEIRRSVAEKTPGNFLIVPEQYSHEAERELCAVCGDSLSLYAEVFSFSRLAVRVAQETGNGGKTALDKGGRLLCMSIATGQIASRLGVYAAAPRKAELQLHLLQAVSELKGAGISAENLRDATEKAEGGLGEKLADLSLCMEAYDAVLARGHADPADRLSRLADGLGNSSLAHASHIYIDGFGDFTGLEMRVLRAILRTGVALTVCLTCDGLDGSSEHFEPSRNAALALLRTAKELGLEAEVSCTPSVSDKPAALTIFEEKLYAYTSESFENTGDCISLVRADSPRDECELAAARCLELVQKTGCRWRDLAIAVRGFDDYAATLEHVFQQYDIPLFVARRVSILQKPAPALIASAFEIILGGWDLDAVLDYLKTGLLPMEQEDRDSLESYALLWGIKGYTWTKKTAWQQHPLGFGKAFDEASTARLEKIDALRRQLVAPLEHLSQAGTAAKTATEQAKALSDFLLEIQLPQTLEARAKVLDAMGRPLLAAEYEQLWGIILKALEQYAALLGDFPQSREEFSKLFLQTLSQYEVAAIPVSLDSVSAGDMDRMRRRHIKHLIVLGAGDERLPRISESSGIFSTEERDELSALGIPLGGGADELSRELSLIYNCISLPSETLYLSFCAFDSGGGQARPGFLIKRASLLFNLEIQVPSLQKARLSAPRPAFLLAANALHGGESASLTALQYFSAIEGVESKLRELKTKSEAGRGRLSPLSVSALYGSQLRISPSRADAFSACRFSYFLRYGLKLNERRPAGFDPPEMGSFMHYVLENAAGEISKTRGFKNVDAEFTNQLVDKYTELYIEEKLHNFADKSPRFIYLFRRLCQPVRRVVTDMVEELSLSDFAPLDFELSFSDREGSALPALRIADGSNELFINGIADRVDGWEHEGKLYLRIVDYKTGKKTFSLSDVWEGSGLQMLLYLFALEREGRERYGREIVPAGVLYVPARDILVSAPGDLSEEELLAARSKKLRRSGLLLNDEDTLRAMERSDEPKYIPLKFKKDGSYSTDSLADPEQLSALRNHVDRRLLELSKSLSEGSIEACPGFRNQGENACLYCPYGSVCRFDESSDKRRYLEKLSPGEFWSRLEETK
ncbi:MAG: PD-(D/E)XK nuclease family protein, partial [Oscillospiraceae bacterium]